MTARVTANSRNKRPTISAMKNRGNQHGNERDGERDDGETDLFGTLEGGLHGGFAHLHIAGDIFDHDNGVVDHEARGSGEGP